MPDRIVSFISSNGHKVDEAVEILGKRGITVKPSPLKIDELQTVDTTKLVRDKALKAFGKIGRPLFVEHTGLYLTHLNGLPGGLTQIFWDALEADRFAELFGERSSDPAATAKTTVAYCDGRRIHVFVGETNGVIVASPRGARDFQWDCVFQPSGEGETFAEMGPRKHEISMRRAALDALVVHLTETK